MIFWGVIGLCGTLMWYMLLAYMCGVTICNSGLKRNALDKKDDYLSVVISDPKVKRDDDDDHDSTMLKINNNTRGQNNNIC